MRWLLSFHTDSCCQIFWCIWLYVYFSLYLFPLLQLIHYWDIKDVTIHVSINAHFVLEDIIVFLVLFVLNLFVYITSC